MPLSAAIEKSERWMAECARLVDGFQFDTSNRNRVAASLQHLCIEHQQGVHLLVEHGVIGSAFALIRPQFESYVRGAWFHLCASDEQVSRFLGGNDPPRIGLLIESLEAKEAYEGQSLSRMKAQVWSNLNDFTHGGAIQVKARNSRDEIISNFKPHHVSGLLGSSATLSLLAGVAIASLASADVLANELRNAYRAVYESEA